MRRPTPANDIGVNGRPMMSIKRAAPPSAASNVTFQGLYVERQLVAVEFWRFQHDDGILHGTILAEDGDVVFGGFLVKLSSPAPQSAMISEVSWWPADRTGRSAKMMECGITPVNVSVSPCNVAPRELSTNSEGTISGLAAAAGVPIVFMVGAV